ncbi:MAG: polysaccharide biosynthesis protein [Clostridiaceae bacterium]|nr:polysaccharide biosynthesis protein [Clostridiaceae bacterium]
MNYFQNKTLLITGGTGSFGNAVLDNFLDSDLKEIRIFSRDELKQDNMRHYYQQIEPELCNKIKFYLGDVREIDSIRNAMYDVDFVFHAAALKQVPSCEFFPMEAVKTNIIGTDNVLSVAIETGVKKVVCLSTDKAVYPVNAMGTSKAMMEKVVVAKSRTIDPKKTLICCTRYGNVLASRGSVVPLFINQIKDNKPLTVTDPKMTRFIMTLQEAVDLVMFAFNNANPGDILVQKAPASTIGVLRDAVKELFKPEHEDVIIGIRHGEKMYETLLTNEECANAIDMGEFYRVPADNRNLNYDKFFVEGAEGRDLVEEFNSNNTMLMSVEEVKEKLLTVPLVLNELKKWKEDKK